MLKWLTKKQLEKDVNGTSSASPMPTTPMDIPNLGSISADNSNDAHEANTTPQLPPLQATHNANPQL